MIRKIGDAIRVKDDELGVVTGRIVAFQQDGVPVAEFADGSRVVVWEEVIVRGRVRPAPKPKPQRKTKPGTPERLQAQRAKRWKKTGVSDSTISWMKKNGML